MPVAIQAAFFGALRATVRAAKALVLKRIVPELPRLIAQAARRGDAATRADAGWQDDLGDMLDGVSEEFFDSGVNADVANAARATAKRTSTKQKDDLRRQFAAVFGIDPVLDLEPWVGKAIDGFVRENVDRITSLHRDTFSRIRSEITSGVRIGRRHEDIAKDLEQTFGVSESRAALIARDQVLSFQADLNKTRQQAAGIDGYTWRSSGDDRVRDEHFDLNGRKFKWDDPPPSVRTKGGGLEPGHPGDAVNCRCTAEPDLDAILASLEG